MHWIEMIAFLPTLFNDFIAFWLHRKLLVKSWSILVDWSSEWVILTVSLTANRYATGQKIRRFALYERNSERDETTKYFLNSRSKRDRWKRCSAMIFQDSVYRSSFVKCRPFSSCFQGGHTHKKKSPHKISFYKFVGWPPGLSTDFEYT